MKNIKVNLSANGIQRAIDEITRYRSELKQKTNKLVRDLVSEGASLARSECPVRTGNLYNSIVEQFDSTESRGYIRVNCPYAVYVEMGTGIKGERSPHPDKSVIGFDFDYDRNGHGEGGWWYPTDASDPNPTKYTAKDGRMYAWTAGMPSRPFMYNAAKQLKDNIRR